MKKALFTIIVLMTLGVFGLNAQIVVDFTKPVAQGGVAVYTNSNIANAPMYEANGLRMLWAGDANGDGVVKFSGANNDKNVVLGVVGLNNVTNVVSGYNIADVNLSGTTTFSGVSNDKNLVLATVGLSNTTRIIQTHVPSN